MKLFPAKIHGAPRKIVVTTSFIPLLLQGVNMAFWSIFSQVRFTPPGVSFIRKPFLMTSQVE